MPRHPGTGRRKAEMKPIEKPEARRVCFSKRRQGLFKKGSELSVLCGAHVGALVFSPAGRAYSFGSPSVDAVVDHYLSGTVGPLPTPRTAAALVPELSGGRGEEKLKLPRLWDADIEGLGLEELREYEEALVELQGEIETRTFQAFASIATATEGHPLGEADDLASEDDVPLVAADDLVAMAEQPSPACVTLDLGAATGELSSLSAEETKSGPITDGNMATKKYAWLSLLPPGQQPLGTFW